ncbi:MAG: DMT family transporter [Candidatus Kapaibacteriota bacterium]|jgi:drug/metabolite transporter (DMT)-like permease
MTILRAELLLVLITVIWGGTFALLKVAVVDISPLMLVWYRFALAAIVSLALWPMALWRTSRQTLVRGVVLGLLYGPGFVLQTMGLQSSSASTSAFITGTLVVFTPFAYWMIAGRRIRPLHLASVVAVVIGLWLFTAPEIHGLPLGDVMTLLAAMQWAIYIVVLDRWTSPGGGSTTKDDHHALVQLQFVVTAALAGIGSVVFESGGAPTIWSSALLWTILYCGLLASVFATWVQTRFQHFTHPVRAGVIYAMEPIAAAVVAVLLLQESWNLRNLAGAAVILAAVVIPDVVLSRRTMSDDHTMTTP